MATVHDSIVRKHVLTEREATAKNKLFKKDRPTGADGRPRPDEVQRTERKQMTAPDDRQLDQFIKEMATEVKKINADAVSRDMLHHQNQVLLGHAQVMHENQQVIQNLLSKKESKRSPAADLEATKPLIQELLKPLQSQIEEVKKIYDETKNHANDVNEALNALKKTKKLDLDDQPKHEKDFTDKFGNYLSTHQLLRKKFGEADDLTKVYKEKFKDLENFETDAYMRTLAKLNKELRELEQRSAKGQAELETRIEGVNKKYNLVLPATYMDAINKKISGINFLSAKQSIDEKLGGEFDYNEFQADIDKVMTDFKADKDMYHLNIRETEVYLPEKPSREDREFFEKIQNEPSILEVLKKKIKDLKSKIEGPSQMAVYERQSYEGTVQPRYNPLSPYPKPAPPTSQMRPTITVERSVQQPTTILSKAQKVSNLYSKPDHLRRIQTKPLPCAVDLKFRKLNPDAEDYQTYFDDPNPMDVAEFEKRRNEPYADQLRKEYEANRPMQDRRQPETQRKPHRDSPYSMPPETDEPTKRPPQKLQNERPFHEQPGFASGLNTQELVEKPIRKPSSSSESRAADQDYYPGSGDFASKHLIIDDLLTKRPRENIIIDDQGQKMIDEDVLKERIGANMNSIKDFFKKGAEFRPFEGMELSNEFPDRARQMSRVQKDTFASQNDQIDNIQGKANVMVKQITDNIATLLNDIVSGIKAQNVAPAGNQSNFFTTSKNEILPPRESLRIPTDRQHSIAQDGHSGQFHQDDSSKPVRLNLDNYYQTLSNYYSNRGNQVSAPTYSLPLNQAIPVRPSQQLATYMNHLDSNRQTSQKCQDHAWSASEGEVAPNTAAGPLQSPRIDRDRSEGELSDLSQRIFFE